VVKYIDMPKGTEKAAAGSSTNSNNTSKTFYLDALNKIESNNIITLYTRDRLVDMMNSGSKKEYVKFKKHFNDLFSLQETFDGED
jgi:hypothetical protein